MVPKLYVPIIMVIEIVIRMIVIEIRCRSSWLSYEAIIIMKPVPKYGLLPVDSCFADRFEKLGSSQRGVL